IRSATPDLNFRLRRNTAVNHEAMPNAVRFDTVEVVGGQSCFINVSRVTLRAERDPVLTEIVVEVRAGGDQSFAAEEPHRQVLRDRLPFESSILLTHTEGVGLISFIRDDVNPIADFVLVFIRMLGNEREVVTGETKLTGLLGLDETQHV